MGEYNWAAGWAKTWCDDARECVEAESLEKVARYLNASDAVTEEDLADLNARELKYLRNYFFAVRGLDFKDAEVKKFYGQFFWYKPAAALKAEDLKLSKAERDFMAKIRKIEKTRQ